MCTTRALIRFLLTLACGHTMKQILSVIDVLAGEALSPPEIDGLVQDIKTITHGSSEISFDQFCELMQERIHNVQMEDELRKAFEHFDHDHDNVISATDLRQVLSSVGEALSDDELNELIVGIDVQGNGSIQLGNFINYMMSSST